MARGLVISQVRRCFLRQHQVATGVIWGLGPYGYIAAMQAVVEMAKKS
jgi:3-dehydroquinate dehydratase